MLWLVGVLIARTSFLLLIDIASACLSCIAPRNALDLLDEQPPDVIEAMLEAAKEAERAGGLPKQRAALRVEILKYAEDYSLKEARARERRLFQGITGLDEGPLKK
jgi:hypothetical protein